MALTDRLFDDLRTKLPGALDNLIKLELWNTVNDLCREALVWRETIPVTLEVNQDAYSIAPEGTVVVEVFSVSHATMDVSGSQFELGTLALHSTPTDVDTDTPLFVVAALAPAISAADAESFLPEDMWTSHHAALVAGVLGRMLGQPAKPYSNPALASFHLREYNRQKYSARRVAETGGIRGAQTWRFPGFAAGTGRGVRRT